MAKSGIGGPVSTYLKDTVGSKPTKDGSDHEEIGVANSDIDWKLVIGVKIGSEPTDLFPIDSADLG